MPAAIEKRLEEFRRSDNLVGRFFGSLAMYMLTLNFRLTAGIRHVGYNFVKRRKSMAKNDYRSVLIAEIPVLMG
jgi:hypothetical protein